MLNALHFKPAKPADLRPKDILLVPFPNHQTGLGFVAHEVDHVEQDGKEFAITLRDGGLRIDCRYAKGAMLLVHRWER
jgi:hypothetical protein